MAKFQCCRKSREDIKTAMQGKGTMTVLIDSFEPDTKKMYVDIVAETKRMPAKILASVFTLTNKLEQYSYFIHLFFPLDIQKIKEFHPFSLSRHETLQDQLNLTREKLPIGAVER